jgi:hypothetical protein
MSAKLTQPPNVPNFCFVVVEPVLYRLDGMPLKRPYYPPFDSEEYYANSRLIQSDWDYPPTARMFGWVGDDMDVTGAGQFLHDNVGRKAVDSYDQ